MTIKRWRPFGARLIGLSHRQHEINRLFERFLGGETGTRAWTHLGGAGLAATTESLAATWTSGGPILP
jgi:hypothetical protein